MIFTNPWATGLISNFQWLLWIGGIALLSLIIGVALFFVGQSSAKNQVSDDEIIAQATT